MLIHKCTHSQRLHIQYTVTWHLVHDIVQIIYSWMKFWHQTFPISACIWPVYCILTLWPIFYMMSVYCVCTMDWRFENSLWCNFAKLLRLCCFLLLFKTRTKKEPWFCSTGYLLMFNQIKRNNQPHLHINLIKAYLYICDSPARNVQLPKPRTDK